MTETTSDTRPRGSLRLRPLEHTDPIDVILRAFLVVCLLGSMAVSIRQWSAPSAVIAAHPVATPAALVQTATPARPSVL